MSSLPTQPYRVSDFSGGITENFIGGGATRSMAADNFWVTVDRKLEERYGSQILSYAPQLPSGNAPINALISHDNEQFLLGVDCPNVYVVNQGLSSILGPSGNPPLVGGSFQDQISHGEWSHQLLLTNDSLNTQPVKIYRGAGYPTTALSAPTSFPFMAVTAGLPSMATFGQKNISDSTLLFLACALANDLKTQMLAHFGDFGALDTNLHQAQDAPGIAALAGAPTAVNLSTLLTLTTALSSTYTLHVNDVLVNFSAPTYHFTLMGRVTPLNFNLSDTSAPTTLTNAATILDDLKTKFFMHEMAPSTHDSNTSYAILGKHLVTQAHIGTVSTGPVLAPNYSQSIALANNLKLVYNAHIADTTYHRVADTVDAVSFPDALDLDTFYILTVWLRWQYSYHYFDSTLSHQAGAATSTSGSPNLTSVISTPSLSPIDIGVGTVLWDQFGTVFPLVSQPVKSIASALGTATASINAISSHANWPFDFTRSVYHTAQNTNQLNESLGASVGIGFFSNFSLSSGAFITYAPNSSNFANWLSLLTQVVAAYNAHDNNSQVHLFAVSLHQSTATAPTVASYSYAFHFFYQYMRYDGVIFDVVGTPILVGPIQTEVISSSSSVGISNIAVLANGGQSNYDVNNVQVKIFRTIAAGSTYYQDGIVSNGTTTFTDTLIDKASDSSPNIVPLNTQTVIYTSGGVVNFDQAPVAKYVTIMQNTAYFGGITDTGQTFPNRIRQSIQNNIDSSPGSFFVDLPDVITGLSNTRNNLLAFCANSIYQITGLFNQLGQGEMSYQSISDTIGCVSSASLVRTDVGIFFAGTDGFYYTDGFQLIKLSSEFNLTYAALVENTAQRRAIYGCYDKYNRRVWWSTQPSPSESSATQSYIFHVNFGVTATGVFTTASNGANYRPSSMIFWQGQQIRGDSRGYLFVHSALAKTDPEVNILTNPTTWNTVVIPYLYASCAVDFGTTFNRKWITRVSVQSKNIGNVGLQIESVSDNGRIKPLALSPVLFRPNLMWGQPNLIWGAPNTVQPLVWDDRREMDSWRRFPASQLRADFKQIKFTPAFTGIYKYQDWPAGCGAQIIPGGGTANVVILTPTAYTSISWPLDVVGYYFSQQGDAFAANYLITGLTTTIQPNDTLVVSDPTNQLQASLVAWVIRGQLKEQRLSLTSYNIHFTLLGKMQQAYQGFRDSGENAPGTSFNQITRQQLITNSGQIIETNDGQEIDV